MINLYIYSITTPTSKRTKYENMEHDKGYADQLVASPVGVDPKLERDLGGVQ
jgi:hypothetical protein